MLMVTLSPVLRERLRGGVDIELGGRVHDVDEAGPILGQAEADVFTRRARGHA